MEWTENQFDLFCDIVSPFNYVIKLTMTQIIGNFSSSAKFRGKGKFRSIA